MDAKREYGHQVSKELEDISVVSIVESKHTADGLWESKNLLSG
jgi:hypothetical protein